jgi:hypothetical protein
MNATRSVAPALPGSGGVRGNVRVSFDKKRLLISFSTLDGKC